MKLPDPELQEPVRQMRLGRAGQPCHQQWRVTGALTGCIALCPGRVPAVYLLIRRPMRQAVKNQSQTEVRREPI